VCVCGVRGARGERGEREWVVRGGGAREREGGRVGPGEREVERESVRA
jgi:hypothetical protein